ncbi:MAG: methyltransferase domain-containing protein, partial [Isosphaeraceae bacterium]
DESFDVVSLIETIQHSPVPDVAVQNAIRCVRPGGSIIVIERNPWALSSDWPVVPAIFLKWLDQYRGRWMYPNHCGVREQWIKPHGLAKQLKDTIIKASISYHGSFEQRESEFQKLIPYFKPFYCYSAQKKDF